MLLYRVMEGLCSPCVETHRGMQMTSLAIYISQFYHGLRFRMCIFPNKSGSLVIDHCGVKVLWSSLFSSAFLLPTFIPVYRILIYICIFPHIKYSAQLPLVYTHGNIIQFEITHGTSKIMVTSCPLFHLVVKSGA